MSYLDLPRLHFSGQFIADPCTVNNYDPNFDLNEQSKELLGWNPNGKGTWGFYDCEVTTVQYNDDKQYPDDPILQSLVQDLQPMPMCGKLVDLDVDQQMVSEIWGLSFSVGDPNSSNSFSGDFKPAAFQDVWVGSAGPGGGSAGARVFYQSVVTNVKWSDNLDSELLNQLKKISGNTLSIKFMIDQFNGDNPNGTGFPDPQNGLAFTHGRIVGTIGPYTEGEPEHMLPGRLLRPTRNSSPAVNFAPCIYQKKRNTLVLDLGNTLFFTGPENNKLSENISNYGNLQVVILPKGEPEILIGDINYQTKNWYSQTAGIMDFPLDHLTSDQLKLIETSPLAIRKDPTEPTPKFLTHSSLPLLQENPDGSYIRANRFVYRLNTIDTNEEVELYASIFGNPVDGALVNLTPYVQKLGPQNPVFYLSNKPESALPIPKVPNTSNGKTSFLWKGTNPGNSRESYLPGQLYFFHYKLGEPYTDTYPYPQALYNSYLSIHLYADYVAKDSPPTWWGDVYQILAPYHKLYPVMSFIDLADYDTVVKWAEKIHEYMNKSISDPMFMPVTRDLSASKLAVLNQWLLDPNKPVGKKGPTE